MNAGHLTETLVYSPHWEAKADELETSKPSHSPKSSLFCAKLNSPDFKNFTKPVSVEEVEAALRLLGEASWKQALSN